jgi:hypothetical protein
MPCRRLEEKPKIGFKLDAARNLRREGGFGAGEPYQKRKIGSKMEGLAPLMLCAMMVVERHAF